MPFICIAKVRRGRKKKVFSSNEKAQSRSECANLETVIVNVDSPIIKRKLVLSESECANLETVTVNVDSPIIKQEKVLSEEDSVNQGNVMENVKSPIAKRNLAQSESERSIPEYELVNVDSPSFKKGKLEDPNWEDENLGSKRKRRPYRKPIRYNSNFSTFFKIVYPKIKEENEKFSLSEVNKKVANMWKNMSSTERDEFFAQNEKMVEKVRSEQKRFRGFKLFEKTVQSNKENPIKDALSQWKSMTKNEKISFGMRKGDSKSGRKKSLVRSRGLYKRSLIYLFYLHLFCNKLYYVKAIVVKQSKPSFRQDKSLFVSSR